jgi:hypothetical protein
MCNVGRVAWLIVALALAGCGSDSTEDRSALGGYFPIQQGQKYGVYGGVSTHGVQPEGGSGRVVGSVDVRTPDMTGQKFAVRGGEIPWASIS